MLNRLGRSEFWLYAQKLQFDAINLLMCIYIRDAFRKWIRGSRQTLARKWGIPSISYAFLLSFFNNLWSPSRKLENANGKTRWVGISKLIWGHCKLYYCMLKSRLAKLNRICWNMKSDYVRNPSFTTLRNKNR